MAKRRHIRRLDYEDLLAELKRRAACHGRSAEVEPDFDALAAELRKLTARRRQRPSEVLLREVRDDR
jgi:plasmid stability protein